MSKNETKLTTKVSSLISGQTPDFVQADHPLFIKFLKDYYRILEAGRLTVTATIQNIVQETNSTNYNDPAMQYYPGWNWKQKREQAVLKLNIIMKRFKTLPGPWEAFVHQK